MIKDAGVVFGFVNGQMVVRELNNSGIIRAILYKEIGG